METTAMINELGQWFCKENFAMLVQSSVLIVVLMLLDLVIRKRVRAVVRYCVWMLVLVKLVLPTSLSMPTGLGYWVDLKDEVISMKDERIPAEGIGSSNEVLITIYKDEIESNGDSTSSMPVAIAATSWVSEELPPNGRALPKTNSDGAETNAYGAASAASGTTAEVPQATDQNAPKVENSGWANHLVVGREISWQGWLFMGWAVGVLVLVSVLVQRFWFVKSLVAQSEPVKADRIKAMMAECRKKVRVSGNVELRLTRNMMSPAACGLVKPVILMPEELLAKLSKDKLRAVLLHELAHIKRGDLWVNLAQTLLQIMYFFNPLLWVANAIIRGVREKAVDEMVLTKMEGDAEAYSSTLVDIAEIAFSRPHFSLRLVGVVESKKALKDRIKHILSRKFPTSARLGMAGVVSILVLAAVLLPMAKGQQKISIKNLGITINNQDEDRDVTYAGGRRLAAEYLNALLKDNEAEISRLTSSTDAATQQLRLSFNEKEKIKLRITKESGPEALNGFIDWAGLSSWRTLKNKDDDTTVRVGGYSIATIKRKDGCRYSLRPIITQNTDGLWTMINARWYRADKSIIEVGNSLAEATTDSILGLLKKAAPDKLYENIKSDIFESLSGISLETWKKLGFEIEDMEYPGQFSSKITKAEEDLEGYLAAFIGKLKNREPNSEERISSVPSLEHKLVNLLEICDVKNIQVKGVYTNNSTAFVTTNNTKRNDGKLYTPCFTFIVYPGGKWAFNDIDWLNDKTEKEFIAGIKKIFPNIEMQTIEKTKALNIPSNEYVDDMAGELEFYGKYKHISRRREIETPGELWIKKANDGSIGAVSYLPWMDSYDIATGDVKSRLASYKTYSKESEGKPEYSIELELGNGEVLYNRHGIREDKENMELTVPVGAVFKPNTRPDSYCVDNIFMRGLDIAVETSKEFTVYDWDNSGEAMASYTIEISNAGIEEVTVPAGTFEANHYVLEQTSTGDTWFKKRNGHITDYWVMDNGIIVRVLRHREPYELQLAEIQTVGSRQWAVENESMPQAASEELRVKSEFRIVNGEENSTTETTEETIDVEVVKGWVMKLYEEGISKAPDSLLSYGEISCGEPKLDKNNNITIRYKSYSISMVGFDNTSNCTISESECVFDHNGNKIDSKMISTISAENLARRMLARYFTSEESHVIEQTELEIGKPKVNKDGTLVVRYKYEALMKDRSKKEFEQLFTFSLLNERLVEVKEVKPYGKRYINISPENATKLTTEDGLNSEEILTTKVTKNAKEENVSIDDFVGVWEDHYYGGKSGEAFMTHLCFIYDDKTIIFVSLDNLGMYNVEKYQYNPTNVSIICKDINGDSIATCEVKDGKLAVVKKQIKHTYNKVMNSTEAESKIMKDWFKKRSVVPFLGEWIMDPTESHVKDFFMSGSCIFKDNGFVDIETNDGSKSDKLEKLRCYFKDGKIEVKIAGMIFCECQINYLGQLQMHLPDKNYIFIFNYEGVRPDKARDKLISSVVRNFWREMSKKDLDAVIKLHYFEDDEHLEEFKGCENLFKEMRTGEGMYISPRDLKGSWLYVINDNRFEIVQLRRTNLKDHWVPFSTPVGYQNGLFKVDIFSKEYLYDFKLKKSMSVEEYGKYLSQKQYDQWTDAEGQELEKLYQEIIDREERNLAAARYAKDNGLEIVEHFSEEKIQERLEKFKSMTAEEWKQEMLAGRNPLDSNYKKSELKKEIIKAKVELTEKRTRYGDNHRDIVTLEDKIKLLEKELAVTTEKTKKVSDTFDFGPVDFDGFYPDSIDGGKALDELMAAKDRDLRDADEIIATVRNGFRRYSGRENVLRWIGNMFIWGKDPQNIKAIELMYHASDSKDFGTAIYFGLSTVKDMTPEIVAAMAEAAMKTDDYYNQVGRIHWGCKNRGKVDELVAYLEKYLESDDPSKRKKAQDLKEYFTDSKAFMAKQAEEHKKKVEQEYAGKLDNIKETLLAGSSQERMATLREKDLYTVMDESFIDELAACLKDESNEVRNQTARIMGNKFVWSGKPQNERVIELLTALLDDPSREVRYTANYFGLSTVSRPSEKLVAKMLETMLDDREINYYGRAIGGVRRNSEASEKILKGWMDEGGAKAVKAYEIYEDVMGRPLPKECVERFAGQKSDAHEGVAALIFKNEPVGKDELKQTVLSCLDDNNLFGKVSELYIIEKRESSLGIVICDNLSNRNAIRDVLAEKGLITAGYMHGKIGIVGSGWLKNREEFREHYKEDSIKDEINSKIKNQNPKEETPGSKLGQSSLDIRAGEQKSRSENTRMIELDGIGKVPVYGDSDPNGLEKAMAGIIREIGKNDGDGEPLEVKSPWTFSYQNFKDGVYIGNTWDDDFLFSWDRSIDYGSGSKVNRVDRYDPERRDEVVNVGYRVKFDLGD